MAKTKKKSKKKASEKPVVMDGDFSKENDGQNGNRVFFSIGKTINIGNYESIRVEVGQGMAVDDGDFDKARNVCIDEATDAIKEIVAMVESGKYL